MTSTLVTVLRRDLTLAFRSGGGWFYGLFFFAIFIALSAIGFGPELAALRNAAPAIIWLALSFSLQFSAATIFESDVSDGSLRVFVAQRRQLIDYIFGKSFALALTSVAPILAATPFALSMLGVDLTAGIGVSFQLLIGAPALIALAVFSSALSTGLRAGGLLAAIIAAPFLAPSLVFGVSATKIFVLGGPVASPETLILGAVSLFMAALVPWFVVQILRISLE